MLSGTKRGAGWTFYWNTREVSKDRQLSDACCWLIPRTYGAINNRSSGLCCVNVRTEPEIKRFRGKRVWWKCHCSGSLKTFYYSPASWSAADVIFFLYARGFMFHSGRRRWRYQWWKPKYNINNGSLGRKTMLVKTIFWFIVVVYVSSFSILSLLPNYLKL